MLFAKLLLVLASLRMANAFRVKRRSSGQDAQGTSWLQTKNKLGIPGSVHGLFPLGSPGPSNPPLENLRGGPCFPGYRAWTVENGLFVSKRVDLATTITGPLGFRHPEIAGLELNWKNGRINTIPCNPPESEVPNLPRGVPTIIHNWARFYIPGASNVSDLLYNVSQVGIPASFMLNRTEAAAHAASFGWSLIGSATDPGGRIYVGEQVSQLIELPQTGACILTFQGSSSTQDWTANAAAVTVDFCGFSGVHMGFRDALMQIVWNDEWQQDIRPKLSSCSEVFVTGHSLGGAQAELFAACAQAAPQPGQPGYDDHYEYIGWTV